MAKKIGINRKGKGTRNERLARNIIEKNGYTWTIKSGASLGIFDVVGMRESKGKLVTLMIQTKSNRNATLAERTAIRNFCPNTDPSILKKQIWIIYDGNNQVKKPPIKIVSFEQSGVYTYYYGFEHHNGQYNDYLKYIF